MEIGWAVDKGFEVLKVSYQIYKAFNDPNSNAPQQFRDLSNEFSAFHRVFSELLDVLKEHKKPLLISLTSIDYTLNKCRLFQRKFGVLSDVNTKRTFKQGFHFGLRTLQWSFLAQKVADELRRELGSHARLLSLYLETLALRNALEDRVENHEIREQNREILRTLSERRESADALDITALNLPDVPQHRPFPQMHSSSIILPDVPRHQPQAETSSSDSLRNLDAACRDLEALERFLETEGRLIDPIPLEEQESSPSSNAANFINLARHEVELQLERVNNYQKRMQSVLSRSETMNSSSTDSFQGVILPSSVDLAGVQHNPETDFEVTRRTSFFKPVLSRYSSISTATSLATGLRISVPIEQASLGTVPRSRKNSMRRRNESLPDEASITLQRYLASFEAELEELDQYDIDGQIAKTRADFFDLIQKSSPPSPDIHLLPTSTLGSPPLSPNIQGILSSSPPSSNGIDSVRRRDTLATTSSRRTSVTSNQWRSLAKDVHIDGIPYACAKCAAITSTVLQVAQRSRGGLCFRLLCVSTTHKLSDGLLYRHDLSSTVPAYPHVYHTEANRGSENHVRVLGSPSKLEASVSGQVVSLKVQPSAGPCYKFVSLEDSECFQQFIRGAKLLKRFNVKTVTSSEYTGHPTRHVAIRLWNSVLSGTVCIVFFASLIDKHEPFPYIENASSFASSSSSGNKVKLKLSDSIRPSPSRHRRTNSRDSGVSGFSTSSDDATVSSSLTPVAAAKIRWIEIEFQDRIERDMFLNIWRGQSA